MYKYIYIYIYIYIYVLRGHSIIVFQYMQHIYTYINEAREKYFVAPSRWENPGYAPGSCRYVRFFPGSKELRIGLSEMDKTEFEALHEYTQTFTTGISNQVTCYWCQNVVMVRATQLVRSLASLYTKIKRRLTRRTQKKLQKTRLLSAAHFT